MLLQISVWEMFLNQLAETSWLEWLGTATGFACVYLAGRQNIWNWPIAIISVLAYGFLFFDYRLYGDAFLQIYFLATSIYGWYYWSSTGKSDQKPVKSLSHTEILRTLAATILLTVFLGYFLDLFTDSDVPYADGFCTAGSFVAQLLMSRKVLQNWILWIIVDICYVPLYLYKDLALTAILYTLFLALAVLGYVEWRKSYRQNILTPVVEV